METMNITTARQNLYKLISNVNVGFNPINIINNKGDSAVLISKNDYDSLIETAYLDSIPGFVASIREAEKEDKSKCSVYDPNEEW